MMTEENVKTLAISIDIYNSICNSVLDYMQSFQSSQPEINSNFILKREHIHRVAGYAEVLARSIDVDESTIMAAQLAAIFHDVGRFEQFEKYKTFNDSISADHAELAVNIINDKNWMGSLASEIQTPILKAVLNHNKISIPKNEDKQTNLLSMLVRDADKLDILALAVQEYSPQNKSKNASFSLDLESSWNVSKTVAKSITLQKLPDKKDLVTVTDFKLLLLSFVYDLNIKESFSIVNKKGYLKQLFDTMPKNDQVFEFYRMAKIHIENQLI